MNVELDAVLRPAGHRMPDQPPMGIRRRSVFDRHGSEIGTVGNLLIDPRQRKVRLLGIDHGGRLGILATPLYVPVETVERITDDMVGIDRTGFYVAAAPNYDPLVADSDERLADLYRYYNLPPARGVTSWTA